MLAECGECLDEPIPLAIESSSLLLVAALLASGRPVYAINPYAVSRYRDRHRASRAKSDARDAIVLANILRTDAHAHRPLPADSEAVKALRVLPGAQQDAGWERVGLTNRIRGLLRRYFPAAIVAFERGGKHRLDSAARQAAGSSLLLHPTWRPPGSSRKHVSKPKPKTKPKLPLD